MQERFLTALITALTLGFFDISRGAFIFLDEFRKQATPPQYEPNMSFEICVPIELPNIIKEQGFHKDDNPNLWCHSYVGWIRMPDDPGGWLDISGMNLGFSTQSWSVWDYATACVIALRERDKARLDGMSDDDAKLNFEKMLADESEMSVPKLLSDVTAMRALTHIRRDGIEWLFVELYFGTRPPSLMALSLRRDGDFMHRFIDAKIQEHPPILNSFIYFSSELAKSARAAMEEMRRQREQRQAAQTTDNSTPDNSGASFPEDASENPPPATPTPQ